MASLSGGLQYSRSANARAASSAGGPAGSSPSEPGQVGELNTEACGEERREPALEAQRPRVRAGEQRGEVRPAKREHRRRLKQDLHLCNRIDVDRDIRLPPHRVEPAAVDQLVALMKGEPAAQWNPAREWEVNFPHPTPQLLPLHCKTAESERRFRA